MVAQPAGCARLRRVDEVRREIVLSAPLSEVWEALTDARHLAGWFANEVDLDARPGGEGVFRWADGSVRRATVDVVEREACFAFRWREDGADEPPTSVVITVAEEREGTRVTVVESASAGPTARAGATLAGEWSWGLELLASLPRLRQLARV